MPIKIEVRCWHWTRQAWGQIYREVDHYVFINGIFLRRFSTHGDMAEGYWGREAEKNARRYANRLARVFRTVTVWTHTDKPIDKVSLCQTT